MAWPLCQGNISLRCKNFPSYNTDIAPPFSFFQKICGILTYPPKTFETNILLVSSSSSYNSLIIKYYTQYLIWFSMFVLPGIPRILDTSPDANSYTLNASSISPYFDLNVVRNVTTTVGQSAFLHCRVYQLGDKSVTYSILFKKKYTLT